MSRFGGSNLSPQSSLGLFFVSAVFAVNNVMGLEGGGRKPGGIEIINADGSRIMCPAGVETGSYMSPRRSVTSTVWTDCDREIPVGPGVRVKENGEDIQWKQPFINPFRRR